MEAHVAAGSVGMSGAEVPAHVVVVAPDQDAARALVDPLVDAGLRVDRGTCADDISFVVTGLPAPALVLVAVDDMLERARIRRALASDPSWARVPTVEMGYGGLGVEAVRALIRDYHAGE